MTEYTKHQRSLVADTDCADESMDFAKLSTQHMAEFLQQHRSELSRFIIRKLGTEEHALDILQDAFLRMNSLPVPEAVENPRAFVFRVVANLIIDFQRRSHNRLPHEADEEAWQSIPENLPGPEIRYQQQQRLEAVKQALAELPEPCRLAFCLNRIDGCNHSEIAERLHISESMVAKHLARAMKHCRGRLKNY